MGLPVSLLPPSVSKVFNCSGGFDKELPTAFNKPMTDEFSFLSRVEIRILNRDGVRGNQQLAVFLVWILAGVEVELWVHYLGGLWCPTEGSTRRVKERVVVVETANLREAHFFLPTGV